MTSPSSIRLHMTSNEVPEARLSRQSLQSEIMSAYRSHDLDISDLLAHY